MLPPKPVSQNQVVSVGRQAAILRASISQDDTGGARFTNAARPAMDCRGGIWPARCDDGYRKPLTSQELKLSRPGTQLPHKFSSQPNHPQTCLVRHRAYHLQKISRRNKLE